MLTISKKRLLRAMRLAVRANRRIMTVIMPETPQAAGMIMQLHRFGWVGLTTKMVEALAKAEQSEGSGSICTVAVQLLKGADLGQMAGPLHARATAVSFTSEPRRSDYRNMITHPGQRLHHMRWQAARRKTIPAVAHSSHN